MALNININFELLPEDENYAPPEFYNKATERMEQQSGYMMRLCHPELSATGVCPVCASFWYVVFNPATMDAIDGSGKVLPVGFHMYCCCEDTPYEIAINQGHEPRGINTELEDLIKSGSKLLGTLSKDKIDLIQKDIVSIDDIFKIKSSGAAKETKDLNQISDVLRTYRKDDLIKILINDVGLNISKTELYKMTNKYLSINILKGLKNKDSLKKELLKKDNILLSVGGKNK